jgi:lysophospholipase L1-like esterase
MMTLPNLLTLSRIVALPLLVALLWWPEWDAAIKQIQQIVGKLGEKHKLPVVRFQKVFDDAGKRAPADYWLFDGVHPFYAGNQLMADEWVRTVKAAWPE